MLLTPEYIFRAIEAITPEFLRQHGITALVLDVDNTLTGGWQPAAGCHRAAMAGYYACRGCAVDDCFQQYRRPRAPLCGPCGPGLGAAGLASRCRSAWAVARRRLGVRKNQMAMVGDQIFTDRLAAGLYGISCLYTMPRGGDHQRGVQFKRRFEPYWLDRYYQKGGRLYE